MTDSILNAALELARQHIPVFPCDGKRPITQHGFYDATTDEGQIRAWFQDTEYNLAMRPSDAGVIVIDVDIGADPETKANLDPTRTIRTPSGGLHFYYLTTENFGNKRLAVNIDIRHRNGYVNIPPSPGYTVIDNRDPINLPEWIAEKIRSAPQSTKYEINPEINRDTVIRVLSQIDPGCSYYDWCRVLAGLSTLDLLDIAEIAMSWSQGEFSNPPVKPINSVSWDYDMKAKLRSFRGQQSGPPITFGTLVHMATGLDDAYRGPPRGIDVRDYTAEAWCTRDLPEIIPLIGPINSTSRVMAHAVTGLGKTHFAMGIAVALAAGVNFCHWSVPKPAKVLYIDGEMPRSLMQKRVQAATKRKNLGGRLILLSHADFDGELGPLKDARGREIIDQWRAWHKPDLVIFDNIQSLVGGDMKETEAWREVQKWARKLPAHIWVHHSNKASGDAYGDKSREWQMDTVIKLAEVEGNMDQLVTFDISFPKHRELDWETNRDHYEKGRFTLSPMGWEFIPELGIRDLSLERFLVTGPKVVSQVAEYCGKTAKTVTNYTLNGKWRRYHDREIGYPVTLRLPRENEIPK